MTNRSTFGSVYFTVLGLIVLGFGVVEIVVAVIAGTGGVTWGPLTISGMWLWWRAIILIGTGAIYLSSVTNFLNINQLAKSVVASVMIWIVAGMEIWTRIASSIPGGEEAWLNPPAVFLATYAPPYMPEIYLLPLSLVVLFFVKQRQRAS